MANKLNKYLTSGLALTGAVANAQVVYTDIDPDSVYTTSTEFSLNLNSDTIVDFNGFANFDINTNSQSIRVEIYDDTLLGQMAIIPSSINYYRNGSQTNTYLFPYALQKFELNDSVDSNLVWNNQYQNPLVGLKLSSTVSSYLAEMQLWKGTEAFAGTRIYVNGDTLYGWVRMYLSSGMDTFKILDYAYESTPNTLILAGAGIPQDTTNTGGGDTTNTGGGDTTTSVYSKINEVEILNSNSQISIQNIDGNFDVNIYSIDGSLSKSIHNSKNINVADLKSGVYLVNLIADDKSIITKKFFID